MWKRHVQPIKSENLWRSTNHELVILPSSQAKLRKNTLFIDQSAFSNFALFVINTKTAFSTANFERATTHIFSKGKIPKRHARSKTENTVQKSQPLRSCVGLSILDTLYCTYSDPFHTGLLKCPYSFLLGQGNGLKCTNSPPHKEKQRPKCTNPSPLWEGNTKNELIPHPLG